MSLVLLSHPASLIPLGLAVVFSILAYKLRRGGLWAALAAWGSTVAFIISGLYWAVPYEELLPPLFGLLFVCTLAGGRWKKQ